MVRVLFRIGTAIVLVAMLGSLVLAGYVYWSGDGGDGFEIAAFVLYPLIAAVVSSIAVSFLILLGVALKAALALSQGRALWLVLLVPLAVVPVVGLAVWPWTLGPPRAEELCRQEGGFRGSPLPVAGYSDAVSGGRDGWKFELARRLLSDGYLFVEEPADAARERVRANDPGALDEFDDGEGDLVRYFVAPRSHQDCDRLPGLRVDSRDQLAWLELGLPSGACLAAERSDQQVARYELRGGNDHQFWPTYVKWDELRVVDLGTGEMRSRFRAFGPPLEVGSGFEDVTSLNPLRIIRAYLQPRQPCGDREEFLNSIATALPPLPRDAALAAVPAPIGRLDFAPRRIDGPGAPFETLTLAAEEVVRENVPPLQSRAFHAAKDLYQPRVTAPAFQTLDYRSERRGIGVAGPPGRSEEWLLVDTGARLLELRLRGFLPEDPRTLRVHSAAREPGGIAVLASFVSEQGERESRLLARLRFDLEGRLRERALAELPPLARPAHPADTFLLEPRSTPDGGLAFVLHFATGGYSSPQYRIRLAPAGHAGAEDGPGSGAAG